MKTSRASKVIAAATVLAGGLTAFAVPSGAANSHPSLDRLYCAFFDREGDTAGYNFWAGELDGGTSLDAVAYSFAASTEFTNTYGDTSNRKFVELVYTEVMNRAFDEPGAVFWTSELDNGAVNRGQMMIQFSESIEYINSVYPTEPDCAGYAGGGTTTSTTTQGTTSTTTQGTTSTTSTTTPTAPLCKIQINYPNAYAVGDELNNIELFLDFVDTCYKPYETEFNLPHTPGHIIWENVTVNGVAAPTAADPSNRLLGKNIPIPASEQGKTTLVVAGEFKLVDPNNGNATLMTATYGITFEAYTNTDGGTSWRRLAYSENYDYVVNPYA